MASPSKRRIRYDPQNDYYQQLGLDTNATPNDIQQAYRRLAKEYHPDLNPSRRDWATAQFQRLNEAYDILSDPASKAIYDERRAPFAWRAQGKNWWDQPHKAEPGYHGIHTNPVRPKKSRGILWLESHHLGFLRPAYMTVNELFIESRFRFVIVFLMMVVCANLFFIMTQLQVDPNPQIVTPVLPTQALLFSPDIGAEIDPQLCTNLYLTIQEIELRSGIVEIKANHPDFLYVNSAQLLWVKLEGDIIRYQGQMSKAELRFSEDSFIPVITSQTLPTGHYLLHWLPHTGGQCDQLIQIVGVIPTPTP